MRPIFLVFLALTSASLTARAQTNWEDLTDDELIANGLYGYDCVTVESAEIDENANYLNATDIRIRLLSLLLEESLPTKGENCAVLSFYHLAIGNTASGEMVLFARISVYDHFTTKNGAAADGWVWASSDLLYSIGGARRHELKESVLGDLAPLVEEFAADWYATRSKQD